MTTNYERIKNMSVEEMAEFSSVFQRCEFCINKDTDGVVDASKCRQTTCKEAIKQWLQAESEE